MMLKKKQKKSKLINCMSWFMATIFLRKYIKNTLFIIEPSNVQSISITSHAKKITVSWKSPNGFVDKIDIKLSKPGDIIEVSISHYVMFFSLT